MKQVYAEQRTVFAPLLIKCDLPADESIRLDIDYTRELIMAQMKQDGADPRHYLFTIYELTTALSLGHTYTMTAERHPDDIIQWIDEQIKIDQGAGSNGKV